MSETRRRSRASAEDRGGAHPQAGESPLYEPVDRVLVRAPLLAVETYLSLPAESDPGRLLADPLVRSAIAVGSPDLFAQLERGEDDGPAARRAQGKLLRYLIRMSTRPTPFGMFAGVALARLGDTTDLRINGAPRTSSRPDMGWLLAFVGRLEQRPDVRRELRFFSNPAAWTYAGRVLLAERAALDGGDAVGVGIRATAAVRRALALARTPVSWTCLVRELLATPGATQDKVERLITELCKQTFLLAELRPPLTRPAPARHVARCLAGVRAASAERAALADLLDATTAWDELGLEERPAAYRRVGDLAAVAVPGHDTAHTQVDSALVIAGGITERVGRAAARAAELLLRLGPPPAVGHLEPYLGAFVNRYGTDREVALPELLDPDRGLGPHSASRRGRADADASRLATQRDATLRTIAIDALRNRKLAAELDEATIAKLTRATPSAATAPISLDLAVVVLAGCAADIDAGNFRLLVGANLGAQAAGRNLGRFAMSLGGEAIAMLATVAAAEVAHDPAALHAELVYAPRRGRSTNVVVRPSLYEHEVVVGTTPGVGAPHAIPLAELLVGVRDRRFYVRWPRLPGDLHVHAGHMLSPGGAPTACRFLEDVAYGGRMLMRSFDWGATAQLPFLPRIEAEGIVLSPARWRLDVARRDADLPPDRDDFATRLARWRADWMVPRRVYLTVADNRLLLDLDAPGQAELLREELLPLEGAGAILLQEPLPGPDHAWLQGPRGHHVAELVVSLVQRAPPEVAVIDAVTAQAPGARTATAPPGPGARLRPPGSAWLYVKLYGSRDVEDDLLTGPVRELGQLATGSGLAERWFFLRYADPAPHLRIRFGGDPERLLTALLPRVCAVAADLIADGSCERLSVDTYEREIERYGGIAAMETAEAIFAVDSIAVVELLALRRRDLPTIDETTLAVLSVDALLDGLGLDIAQRLRWYGEHVHAKHDAGGEYRERKVAFRRLLGDPQALSSEPGGEALGRVLHARHAALAPLARHLHALERDGRLTKAVDRVCESYVHLHCNRLLGVGPPTEQRVLGLALRTAAGLAATPARRP